MAGGIAILGWALIDEARHLRVEASPPHPGCERPVRDDALGMRCARDDEPDQAMSGPVAMALGARIDVNLASADDLKALPGIGPKLSQAIVARREAAGPYQAVADLVSVRGIGPQRFGFIQPYVRAGPPP